MDFSKFVLGLRFPIQGDARQTAEHAWKLIFSALSAAEAVGIDLHETVMERDEMHTEPALLCVLSNMSLSKCRKVYAKVAANPMLRSHLMFHEPYILSNQAEELDGYLFLGRVSEQGVAGGGEECRGDMRFCGINSSNGLFKKRAKTVLIATGAYGDGLSAEQTVRELMRAAADFGKQVVCIPFPIGINASELADALILLSGGRYTTLKNHEGMNASLLYCGILPDRTFVFAVDSIDAAKEYLSSAYAEGYRSILIGIAESVNENDRKAFLDESREKYAEAKILLLEDTWKKDIYLKLAAFDQKLKCADVLVCGGKGEIAERMIDAMMHRCKRLKKKCLLVPDACADRGTDAIVQLRESARSILSKI